jgi:hypothetical protein
MKQYLSSARISSEVHKAAIRLVKGWVAKTERMLLKDPLLTREALLKYSIAAAVFANVL